MKKFYVLLFVTVGIILSAHAQDTQNLQFKKGDKLLGGSLGISNRNPSGSNNGSTYINVSPSFGFFTKPNRLTGFSLLFSSNNPNGNKTYGASIYKQYWNNLGKKFYFIIHGEVGGYYSKRNVYSSYQYGYTIGNEKSYTVSASFYAGFAYRINRRLLVDAYLPNLISLANTYTKSKITDFSYSNPPGTTTSSSNSNEIRFNTALSGFSFNNIQFGFRYIL